jgi:hypothetical protein
VLEFVGRVPFEYKLRGNVTKWILKAVARDLLPAETLALGKQGFGMPLERWLGADFCWLAREVLLDRRARGRGWFDPAGLEPVLHGSGPRDERPRRPGVVAGAPRAVGADLSRPPRGSHHGAARSVDPRPSGRVVAHEVSHALDAHLAKADPGDRRTATAS